MNKHSLNNLSDCKIDNHTEHEFQRAANDDLFMKCHPVLRRLPTFNILKYIRHHAIPGLNQHGNDICDVRTTEEASTFYKELPFGYKYPLPLNISDTVPTKVLNGFDPVPELPKKKQGWKVRKKQILNLCHRTMKSKHKKSITDFIENKDYTSSKMQPCVIAKLANHFSKNPDEYFKGVYNWYYGNTLAFTCIDEKYYVLSVIGEDLDTMCAARFKFKKHNNIANNLSQEIKSVFSISLVISQPILDIVVSDIKASVYTRQRNTCSYMTLYEDDVTNEICADKSVSIISNEYPFVSLDARGDEFCTITADRTIKLWSPEYSKKCKMQSKVPDALSKNTNLHLSGKYSCDDGNIIVVTDKSTVFCLDKRTSLAVPCSTWQCEPLTELCEEISLLLPSWNSTYWYIGLTHTFFTLDTRSGFIQKWTHMLPHPPSVGCVQQVDHGNKREELIHISSQTSDNVVGIYNDWTSGIPKSNCLPYSIPTRSDTLLSARINGTCLNPSLNSRFKHSITGLASYKKKGRIGLLLSSSTGGVFHQPIYRLNTDTSDKEKECLNDTDIQYLSKWETEIEANGMEEKVLHYMDIFDMSNIFDNIDVDDDSTSKYYKRNGIVKDNWQISKKELESYVDFLAPIILSDFGIDEESEWENIYDNNSSTDDEMSQIDSTAKNGVGKVLEWLTNSSTKAEYKDRDIENLVAGNDIRENEADSDISICASIEEL